MRNRLQSHKRGDEGRCIQQATFYRRERHKDPVAREQYLQNEYLQKYGKLPKCNQRIG